MIWEIVLTVNGSVYDVSIREPDLDWVIIVLKINIIMYLKMFQAKGKKSSFFLHLDGDDFNRNFLVGEPNISSFMKYDLECEWPF